MDLEIHILEGSLRRIFAVGSPITRIAEISSPLGSVGFQLEVLGQIYCSRHIFQKILFLTGFWKNLFGEMI